MTDINKFRNIDKETQPVVNDIYKQYHTVYDLRVSPEKILFLSKRSNAAKYAYTIMLPVEFSFLDIPKQFAIVFLDKYYDLDEDQRKYVIIHELKHCHYNPDKDRFSMLDHDVQNFANMLSNPSWNMRPLKPLVAPEVTDDEDQ